MENQIQESKRFVRQVGSVALVKEKVDSVSYQNLKYADLEIPTSTVKVETILPSAINLPVTKRPSRGPVKIVSRDLEIIEFLLEMKFASLDEVFEKFFSTTKLNVPAKSSDWARDRLARLESYGYLKGILIGAPPVKHFIVTRQGHTELARWKSLEKLPGYSSSIDIRIFQHDKMVLKSRLEFEKANPEGKWISDRKLRSGMAAMFSLPSAYIPDAIYEKADGERVAFELENAVKGRGAYREKVSYFARLIEVKKDDPNMFQKVRFRCVREESYKILKEESDIYPGLFTVELWEQKNLVSESKVVGGENA